MSHNFATLATCSAKSSILFEYPHSLSYHDMSLWKLSFNPIPAYASNIDDYLSCKKSEEATSSLVYPNIP